MKKDFLKYILYTINQKLCIDCDQDLKATF